MRIGSLALAGISAVSLLYAQGSGPAWMDQLKAQYKMVKMAPDMTGINIIQPGTALAIQKGGILGVPFTSLGMCTARYKEGDLHAPTGLCPNMVKAVSRYFQVGEQIYPFKIDVNVKKEQITVILVACDSCNGTNPPTYMKSEVVFEFGKGFLEAATFAQVQSDIGQVFRVPDDGNAAATPAPAVTPAETPAPVPDPVPAPIAAPAPPADDPAPAPATIEVGQTVDQVIAILGQPQRIAKAGAKEIYFYKNLKVTFNSGKVSDID